MMTAKEELAAFQRMNRIERHIHRALTRGDSIAEFFAELVAAHEREAPAFDWTPLRSINVDELDELRARLLAPLFARTHATNERHPVSLLVGIDDREARSNVADLYATTTTMTASSTVFEWPGRQAIELAGSRVMDSLSRAVFEGERAPGHEGGTVLLGYAAKAVALLLARPLEAAGAFSDDRPHDVFVGRHQGRLLFVGRIDVGGFIATPPPIAAARLRAERARYVAAIGALEGPPVGRSARGATDEPEAYARAFRHPDGRRSEIRVSGDQLHLRFVDEDGDEMKRVRTSEDPHWEAQALARDQLLNGFTEGDLA
jgi:hypothetical protein